MPRDNDTDESDLRLIRYRIEQLEVSAKVILEVRDAMFALAADMRASKGSGCPAPGSCIPLAKRVDEVEEGVSAIKENVNAINETLAWSKGAVAGLGVLGVANLGGLVLQYFSR